MIVKRLKEGFPWALGVFVGNFAIYPLIFTSRTFFDGLLIGLIAAFIVLVFHLFIPLPGKKSVKSKTKPDDD